MKNNRKNFGINFSKCVNDDVVPLNKVFFSADVLQASPFPEECQSLSETEITPMVPTALDQQVETPRSSSPASDLHLSGLCRFLLEC